MQWVETGNSSVAVYVRQSDNDTLLILNNLSSSVETVNIPLEYQKTYMDLFTSHTKILTEDIILQPYSYLWLQMQR
jgi:hypothetical protein